MSKVCVIPGEGAAAEAVAATLHLLQDMNCGIEWHRCYAPCERDAEGKWVLAASTRELIDGCDATLFGATAGPAASAMFYLRWGKQTFANLRPTRFSPGMASPLVRPDGIDFVIVRENLEDAYLGLEGDISSLDALNLFSRTTDKPLTDYAPGTYAVKIITVDGSDRVLRFAFDLAQRRKAEGKPGRVTASAKGNMLPKTDGLFLTRAEAISREYPEIDFETLIVDDCAHRLVRDPHRFDVLVLPNLYGDILSDAAAGLTGGLGVAASGCYGHDYAYFEAAHGTAPDIAGRGVVNPTATLLSAALMLEYLSKGKQAAALRRAIDTVYAQGRVLTPDQGGSATTSMFCDAVQALI